MSKLLRIGPLVDLHLECRRRLLVNHTHMGECVEVLTQLPELRFEVRDETVALCCLSRSFQIINMS